MPIRTSHFFRDIQSMSRYQLSSFVATLTASGTLLSTKVRVIIKSWLNFLRAYW